jgi:aspartyl/asparaginyl beta-hydroxylase (cupin superfamily)
VHELVPTHGVVTFSVLQPVTTINPHRGYQGDFLRCHLGLSIPAGDCRLRVGGVDRSWEPGRAMVFDDRVEHEAWNRTDRERTVLLFDFVPDTTALGTQ